MKKVPIGAGNRSRAGEILPVLSELRLFFFFFLTGAICAPNILPRASY